MTRLVVAGLLDSTELDVPDERALSFARICWRAGGAIAIDLRHGDSAWMWRGGRDEIFVAAMRLGGMQ